MPAGLFATRKKEEKKMAVNVETMLVQGQNRGMDWERLWQRHRIPKQRLVMQVWTGM